MKTNVICAAIALCLLSACASKMDAPAMPEKAAAVDVDAGADAMQDATASTVTTIAQLQEIMAMPHRDAANVARDQYRNPAQTLDFFGITPSMTVVEVTPGAGWYAEILAPYLKDGKYIAAANDPSKASSARATEYFGKANQALRDKFAASPVYAQAQLMEIDPKMPKFGADGSADMVLTFRNVHNWAGGGTGDAMFKAFYAALKPGGILGVVEHRANPDKAWDKASGYMLTADVIKMASAAGFMLEAQSEINANPKDTKDYEGGVWTLPPSLGQGEKDRAKYVAIGESDRMTLRFRKAK